MSMQTVRALLGQVPGLRSAARADAGGNVQEVAGQLDAETVCAIATLCGPHLEGASEYMQLGRVRGFAVVSDKMAMYVHQRADGLVVATGEAVKNPDAQLKKIAQLLGDMR